MGGGNVPEWSVADRLRKAREWAGLDQVELARMTAISRATISAAENGRRKLRDSSIRLWAVSTGVSLTWIETGTASNTVPPDGIEPSTYSLQGRQLPRRLRLLTAA